MDIQQKLQDLLESQERIYQKSLKLVNDRLERALSDLEYLKGIDLPEKTDTIQKLQAANGRPVVLEDAYSTFEDTLDFSDARINTSHGSYPLIGATIYDGIKTIIDKETGKVVFKNPCFEGNVALQYAILLGKKAGLEEAQLEIEDARTSKENTEKGFEDAKESIKNIPDWIKRGEKYIYPQRKEQWEGYLTDAISIYRKAEVEKALDIIELLSKNGKIEDALNIMTDPNQKGIGSAITASIVTRFSKRGPEFYRGLTHENPEWLQKIESENKNFERALGGK